MIANGERGENGVNILNRDKTALASRYGFTARPLRPEFLGAL